MRHPLVAASLAFLGLVLVPLPGQAAETSRPQVHHDLRVGLDPATHGITVRDEVSFPAGLDTLGEQTGDKLTFALHAGLEVECLDAGFEVRAVDGADPGAETGSEEEGEGHALRLRTWEVTHVDGAWPDPLVLDLSYRGTIHHPPVAEGQEYARSFARTVGTIGDDGVVLTRATWWVPFFGEDLLSFRVAVELPTDWTAVSQGRRVRDVAAEGSRVVAWECLHPMEEVYLIANRYTEYDRSAGAVQAQAFLRTPDENLANRYLEATVQYLEMYRKLIGPYPFEKFALVENFWETGYGMPSFTLLGPQVIRLPFILHSSYPHEILHNWWGNSVYVDWQTGNWCEGLTAYLADHLIREGQGRGTAYRRDTLKKYRSYVSETRDFPLREFRSRHSGATEAVGYGKSLMLFHMLRRQVGEAAFARGIQTFYRRHRWTQASFDDLAAVFSEVAETDLRPFFAAWVDRAGAPTLAMDVSIGTDGSVTVDVTQQDVARPFPMHVKLAATLAGRDDALVLDLDLSEGRARGSFDRERDGRVVRLDLDPEYDVFRRLDREEIPPTLGSVFGAERVTIVLPPADDPLADGWRGFARAWAQPGQVEVVEAAAIEALPADRAVWVLGRTNPWARALTATLEPHAAGVGEDGYAFGAERTDLAGHAAVFTARHPADPELTVGWICADRAAALPGLTRKLPHYGKYSFLAFEGDAPDNVVKGTWPATLSPLVQVLEPNADGSAPARGKLPRREPLARLAPVFDPARLMGHVEFLASEEMRGRAVGTPELDRAANHIAQAFEAAGLEPGGADGSFFDDWTEADGPDGEPVRLRNVIGVLPGRNPAWAAQSVVLGAHYDHLGLGWPDVRAGHEGKIHNGADDNASGVAVLLELAQLLGQELKPSRSVVFVAFTGEEWGRKGSKHYVETMRRWPAKQAIGMVNLDTVGRLEGKKLLVLGSGTATEWRHVAMGVGYTTGVESTCVADDPQGSDQVSFHEVGVPAVQLFSGPHEDYHRSTDDIEKIDAEGLVKVATFARESIVYLSERAEPLTSTLAGAAAPGPRPAPGAGRARRVSLGTMPDFAFGGPGVKVASVMEGSAAAAAGIQPGDLVLGIDGEEIANLKAYSDALKSHAPGDVIRIRLQRGAEELEVEATLTAR